MSLEASFKDVLLGTPTCSSSASRTSSSAAEAVVLTESSSKGVLSPRPVACPAESTLTLAVVATPTQLAKAPAEVPFDEGLPLTLQAYPHLRNTPAAKGWCRRLSCLHPLAPLAPPCPRTPPNGLEARGPALRPRPRREPTVAAHPTWQWWLAGMLVSPASPVEGACSDAPSAGVYRRTLLPRFRAQGSRRPQLVRESRTRAILTMEKPHDATPRAVARCTHRPGRVARRRRRRTLEDRPAPPPLEGAAAA